MALITDFSKVKEIYAQAAEKGWVIPCFCSENLTTSEAVLSAAQDFARKNNRRRIPVTLAMTVRYSHRPQASYYTHTRRWDTGLRLFTSDAKILSDKNGPFPDVDVLLHLDHVQHDADLELLENWDLAEYSSIMYDASNLPFAENIQKTAAFAEKMRGRILIEGACDEIFNAGGEIHNALTTPEKAGEYMDKTKVDLIVANLGTEHRAGSATLHYFDDMAKKIKKQIGAKIVLHGLSSVSLEQVKNLYGDGICKVNIWTMLERDSSPALLGQMEENADKIAGKGASLSHFTTVWRQDIIFSEMKKIVSDFFEMWYK
ncbi:MAG: class II fructose-bisphosphate aldolase [Oscillospiraceae bacterium]|nr:class II fructose-bisphosphate aldolase [Oscillospiraceae bacterium]